MKKLHTLCSVFCGLLPLWLLLVWLARQNPDLTEAWYARQFYPAWAGAFLTVTSPLPFSLAEALIVAAIPVGLFWLASFCRALARKKGKRLRVAVHYLIYGAGACSVVLMLFLLGGGFNYYRYSFTRMSGLAPRASEVEQLALLCEELVAEANRFRETLPQDGAGVSLLSGTARETAVTARESYRLLMDQNPRWAGYFDLSTRCLPKRVFFSEAMSYMEIVGVFTPYTVEANVNFHTTDFDIPFAACHELAHISGFMREDEANFLAYAACRSSGDPFFRYSGAATALIHAGNALYGKDPDRYARVMEGACDGLLRDFAASSAYYRSHHTSFGEFSTKVNDTYLKVNSQPQGVATYGRMVDLLLADYRVRHDLD